MKNHWFFGPFLALLFGLLLLSACDTDSVGEASEESAVLSPSIQPAADQPQYWQYKGEKVLLLGGSDEDNLFQMPDVAQQLDLLKTAGGNYVRNTMSSRDEGNVWAFAQDSTGQYDLRKWNEAYWQRFENFLALTAARDIIVQIEIWATFDFYRGEWDKNPFNPKNNRNLNEARVKLPTSIPTHPIFRDNPFFWSIPSQHNNMHLLQFQQAFVDKILSISLPYDHVLYCMDNETSVTADWGKFWSDYIHKVATEKGRQVFTTEMWDPHDLNHISHRETFDHPETYDFVEISQNNHQKGEAHWLNGLAQIERLKRSGALRPVTNVKTYGSTGGRHGHGLQNGVESFVRSVLFGSSAVRFHRPTSGIGLSDTAQVVIKGIREVTDQMNGFFAATPNLALLSDRSENEAYCRALVGQSYLVYFGEAGEATLDLSALEGEMIKMEVLELFSNTWRKVKEIKANSTLRLTADQPQLLFLLQK